MQARRPKSTNMFKVIGLIVGGYLIFAGLLIALYEPGPEDANAMDWEDRQQLNQQVIATLSLGTSKQEVLQQLGAPNFNDAQIVDGTQVQLIRYRTHHVSSDGETTPDECTPLLFVANELVGIGDQAVARYQNADRLQTSASH